MLEEEENDDSTIRTTTNTEGSTITIKYSSDNRSVVKLTDGNGNIYRNSFNNDSNLNDTIYPDGLRQSYTYDNGGNLQTRTSRSSKQTMFQFTGGNTTYFFYGAGHGLISQLKVHQNNKMYSYQYDHIGYDEFIYIFTVNFYLQFSVFFTHFRV